MLLPFWKHVEYSSFHPAKGKSLLDEKKKKVKPQNRLSKSDISGFPLIVNDQSRSKSENNWRYLKQLKVSSE